MDTHGLDGNGTAESLPPPPPIPPDVVPLKVESEQPAKKIVARVPVARRGQGSRGQPITLLTNHFKVHVAKVDGHFFHYCVSSALFLCAILAASKYYLK